MIFVVLHQRISIPASLSHPSKSVNPDQPRLLFLSPQRRRQRKVANRTATFTSIFAIVVICAPGLFLGPSRNREGIHDSIHWLVGAHVHYTFSHRAPDKLLNLLADFEISIWVEIVVNDVAVFQRDPEPQRVIAIHKVMPQIFDLVAFFRVVDERTIEIGVQQQVPQRHPRPSVRDLFSRGRAGSASRSNRRRPGLPSCPAG